MKAGARSRHGRDTFT